MKLFPFYEKLPKELRDAASCFLGNKGWNIISSVNNILPHLLPLQIFYHVSYTSTIQFFLHLNCLLILT